MANKSITGANQHPNKSKIAPMSPKFILLLLVLFIVACTPNEPTPPPSLEIKVYNNSTLDVTNLWIGTGKDITSFGWLPSGTSTSYRLVPNDPPTAHSTISYLSADGSGETTTIPVVIPEPKMGKYTLVITPGMELPPSLTAARDR
jgi:hypothetical protein